MDTTTTLTRAEGYAALDYLGRLNKGGAVMWHDEDGALRVADNPEPEPPPRTTQQPPSEGSWSPPPDPWLQPELPVDEEEPPDD